MKIIKDTINIANRAKYRLRTYANFLTFSLFPNTKDEIVNRFHNLYYDSNVFGETWRNTKFLGVPIQKCPFDLFVYQEILHELEPDIIIETGTASGGGAYFLASMCDLINYGKVITIDITNTVVSPEHKRITYLIGSSTSDKIVNEVKDHIKNKDKILVILDSDHSKKHVQKELKIYSKFVSKDSYIIIEDSNVNGYPVNQEHGPGPMEAIVEFLELNKNFEVDKSREKHYITFNPNGYLKRVG